MPERDAKRYVRRVDFYDVSELADKCVDYFYGGH